MQFNFSFVFLLDCVSPRERVIVLSAQTSTRASQTTLKSLLDGQGFPFLVLSSNLGIRCSLQRKGSHVPRKSKQLFILPGPFSSCCCAVILQPTKLSLRAKLGRPSLNAPGPRPAFSHPDQRSQGEFHFGLFPKHQELSICGTSNFSLSL